MEAEMSIVATPLGDFNPVQWNVGFCVRHVNDCNAPARFANNGRRGAPSDHANVHRRCNPRTQPILYARQPSSDRVAMVGTQSRPLRRSTRRALAKTEVRLWSL